MAIPADAIKDYERVKSTIDLAAIAQRERITLHDVKARIEEFSGLRLRVGDLPGQRRAVEQDRRLPFAGAPHLADQLDEVRAPHERHDRAAGVVGSQAEERDGRRVGEPQPVMRVHDEDGIRQRRQQRLDSPGRGRADLPFPAGPRLHGAQQLIEPEPADEPALGPSRGLSAQQRAARPCEAAAEFRGAPAGERERRDEQDPRQPGHRTSAWRRAGRGRAQSLQPATR